MYKKLYVAVDGSAESRQATDLAIALGHLFDAPVITSHVDESAHRAARATPRREQPATSSSPRC